MSWEGNAGVNFLKIVLKNRCVFKKKFVCYPFNFPNILMSLFQIS